MIAGTLAAGGFWGYGSLVNRLTEPTEAPKCYWPEEAYVPRNEAMPLVGAPDRNGVPNNRRRMGQVGHRQGVGRGERHASPALAPRQR